MYYYLHKLINWSMFIQCHMSYYTFIHSDKSQTSVVTIPIKIFIWIVYLHIRNLPYTNNVRQVCNGDTLINNWHVSRHLSNIISRESVLARHLPQFFHTFDRCFFTAHPQIVRVSNSSPLYIEFNKVQDWPPSTPKLF